MIKDCIKVKAGLGARSVWSDLQSRILPLSQDLSTWPYDRPSAGYKRNPGMSSVFEQQQQKFSQKIKGTGSLCTGKALGSFCQIISFEFFHQTYKTLGQFKNLFLLNLQIRTKDSDYDLASKKRNCYIVMCFFQFTTYILMDLLTALLAGRPSCRLFLNYGAFFECRG